MALRRLLIPPSSFFDRHVGWDRLPRLLGIVTLIGLREQLREQNLHDTGLVKPRPDAAAPPARPHARRHLERRARAHHGECRDALWTKHRA